MSTKIIPNFIWVIYVPERIDDDDEMRVNIKNLSMNYNAVDIQTKWRKVSPQGSLKSQAPNLKYLPAVSVTRQAGIPNQKSQVQFF